MSCRILSIFLVASRRFFVVLKKNDYGRNVHSFGRCRHRCMQSSLIIIFGKHKRIRI